MSKIILSIDASTTCTGYTLFEVDYSDKTWKHINTKSIKATDKNIYNRFNTMHEGFNKENLYSKPDVVVFENYAFAGNRITQLAELNGLLKYNFALNDVDIKLIAPNTIKKWVAGHGHAKKPEIRSAIENDPDFNGFTFNNEDESDSCGVGLAYIKMTLELGENFVAKPKRKRKRKIAKKG